METDFTNIKGMFKANTSIVDKAIEDINTDDWFRKPGDDSNHLMWLLGHIVVHRGHTLKTLGVDWDNSWAQLFARGTERMADEDILRGECITRGNRFQRNVQKRSRPPGRFGHEREGPPSFDCTSATVAFLRFHMPITRQVVSSEVGWIRPCRG